MAKHVAKGVAVQMGGNDSIQGVVSVEVLAGKHASKTDVPKLLVEVPHGADRRHHYDALAAQLHGPLPKDLDAFFSLNTDVGAYAYGRVTAEQLLQRRPQLSVLLVRSLIPRTFIDCNRPATSAGGELGKGGLTAGIPSYVKDAQDQTLLTQLHAQYVDIVERAYAEVCGAGGFALVPHSYGPRSLGIDGVDEKIVDKLRWAYAPQRVEQWPLRAEVDLLTRDGEGTLLAPGSIEDALIHAFGEAGMTAKANDTYYIHPSSLAHTWSSQYPGQLICMEVRRDLLVPKWDPFVEMLADPHKVQRVADVLTPTLAELLAD